MMPPEHEACKTKFCQTADFKRGGVFDSSGLSESGHACGGGGGGGEGVGEAISEFAVPLFAVKSRERTRWSTTRDDR